MNAPTPLPDDDTPELVALSLHDAMRAMAQEPADPHIMAQYIDADTAKALLAARFCRGWYFLYTDTWRGLRQYGLADAENNVLTPFGVAVRHILGNEA